ncbi:hypothetical protein ACM6Q7_25915, partial [Peribacillus butanolivorans]|uniref:hypothetical protein n=1 Tax=Peribacillus butanolivorans TaxID=421767 RepID=UPI0039FCD3F2
AMKVTNKNNQSLIGEYKDKINSLSGLAFEREVQLKDLKEVLAARLENSTKENAELHKQVDAMKVTNKNNQSLIGEYKDKINSLSGLVVEREVQLKDLKEALAARLENSTKENAELHKQLDAMKVTNENNQSLIGEYKEKIDSLSGQVDAMKVTNENSQSLIGEYKEKIDSLSGQIVEREVQLKDLKEVLAARLENSTKKNAELHKQKGKMKATNKNNQTLTEYKEKIDSWLASPLTNHQSEPQAKEENSLQKAEWKSQKKKLKQLLKEHPKATENELAELLGVDSSYVIELRKEFGI